MLDSEGKWFIADTLDIKDPGDLGTGY